MIIGHGAIASVLEGLPLTMDPDWIFFASGVSNSQEIDETEYRREKALLLQQDEDKHIVYFSSLGVFNRNERYFEHKREMEVFIKSIFNKYTIFRIGNILWENDNPHTFLNAYRKAMNEGREFVIRDEWRYVIDKNEFLYWVGLIPQEYSCEINIPGQRMKVADIIKQYGNT